VDLKEIAVAELTAVRERSLGLLAPLDESDLLAQHSPLMSPLVWDLAHVGNYEELWLARAAGGLAALDASLDNLYDAFRHPRANRPSLPLLGPAETCRYLDRVRNRSLSVIESADFDSFDANAPLWAGGFVIGLCVQHEHQHDETMLATLQLMDGDGYRPRCPSPPVPSPGTLALPTEVLVPGGPFVMGTDDEAWAYDNERPAHVVDLPAFWIDTFPATNGEYLAFMEDGGYGRRSLWTSDGWAWRQKAALEHPQYWRREGPASWSRCRFGWIEGVPADEPVQHVCWYEADAYARWAGKRLPTEDEWEKAAGRPGPGRRGPAEVGAADAGFAGVAVANLGGRHFRPAPVGSFPSGASWCGAQQLLGDVWEWTSSDFVGYPGFASFPYREYSEVFFGPDYKVLRGGSWATDPSAVRTSFRNWDYPIRRQIFAGFRCARDA
jgi:gamma-glutamyl hercynylcysteine S-oxide synthase